jgi:peptidoglycan/LPS O-acetylase OafA/YrhL
MRNNSVIPSLTGIRALCVYCIFFYHLNPFTAAAHPQWHLLFAQFYTFLTFFFVLSGFVICHKYYDIGSLKKTALYNYFVNRMSRVFPILFILITITFLLYYRSGAGTISETLKLYLLNVTLLKGFAYDYHLTGIGPSWSMSVEELFYALSPLIFLWMRRRRDFLMLILIVYGLGVLITFVCTTVVPGTFFSTYQFTFYTTFFGRIFEFVCGVYLALIVKGKFSPGLLGKVGKASLSVGWVIVALAIAGQYWVARQSGVTHGIETWTGLALNNLAMPVGITFIFYSFIYHDTWLQRLLSTKVMVALGNATYSFYLLHTSFVLSLINKYVSSSLIVSFFVMIVVAYGFHKTVEQPLAIYFRKRFSRKMTPSADGVTTAS